MKGVYILSDYSDFLKEITHRIDLKEDKVISVPSAYDQEYLWHNWINHIFTENDIKRLIIPVSLPTDSPNCLGLIIGLHLRLNYEIPLEKRMVPIVFLSDFELGNVIKLNSNDFDYYWQQHWQRAYISKNDVLTQKIKGILIMAESNNGKTLSHYLPEGLPNGFAESFIEIPIVLTNPILYIKK